MILPFVGCMFKRFENTFPLSMLRQNLGGGGSNLRQERVHRLFALAELVSLHFGVGEKVKEMQFLVLWPSVAFLTTHLECNGLSGKVYYHVSPQSPFRSLCYQTF